MDTSEDEVFIGPVTAKELQYLHRKKFVPSRKTEYFLSPLKLSESNSDEGRNSDTEEAEKSFIHDENKTIPVNSTLDLNTETTEYQSVLLGVYRNTHSKVDGNSRYKENDFDYENNESPSLKAENKVFPVSKLVPECALPPFFSPLRTLSGNKFSPQVISWGESSFSNVGKSNPDDLEERSISTLDVVAENIPGLACSLDFKKNDHCMMKRNTEQETLLDTFEDLHLVSLPPGGDFTLTLDKTLGSQMSPVWNNYQRRTAQGSDKLSDLKEDEEFDNSDQCIPPTPCNTTVESGVCCSRVISSGEHFIPETPCNSEQSSAIDSDTLEYPTSDLANPYVRADVQNIAVNDMSCEVLRKDVETTLFYNSPQKIIYQPNQTGCFDYAPTPCNSTAGNEGNRLGISKTEDESSLAVEDDIHIITINGSDETNLSVLTCPRETYNAKENHSPARNLENKILNETSEANSQPKTWVNKISVPEMTEEQQNMLRELWCSPQQQDANVSTGSPLMNALDLPNTNEPVFVVPTSSATSLATLDLSVDDRIPVTKYIKQINTSRLTPVEIQTKTSPISLEDRRTPLFKPKKTPMKLISNQVGIVNLAINSLSPGKVKEDKNSKTGGETLYTPLKTKPQHSGIPVAQSGLKKVGNQDFKNPNMHGISTYRSKVSQQGKFFSTPNVARKWDVRSPVAKYINEDPVQPLVKIVRPKEQRTLPIKQQTPTTSKTSIKVPPSPENVPVAHYKLRQTTPKDKVTAASGKTFKAGRLFPSPYTPTVTRHEGAKKGIPGAHFLSLQQLARSVGSNSMNSSDAKLNKSTVEPVVLQRTNTLFKPID